MKLATPLKKLLSAVLVAVMLVGSLPVSAFAAEEPIVLLGGGDYQQAGSHTNSADNVSNILDRITDAGFTGMDGFLFVGDYDCETHDSSSETAAGISSLKNTVSGYYGNINHSNSILVQGNHDYPNANIDATGETLDASAPAETTAPTEAEPLLVAQVESMGIAAQPAFDAALEAYQSAVADVAPAG